MEDKDPGQTMGQGERGPIVTKVRTILTKLGAVLTKLRTILARARERLRRPVGTRAGQIETSTDLATRQAAAAILTVAAGGALAVIAAALEMIKHPLRGSPSSTAHSTVVLVRPSLGVEPIQAGPPLRETVLVHVSDDQAQPVSEAEPRPVAESQAQPTPEVRAQPLAEAEPQPVTEGQAQPVHGAQPQPVHGAPAAGQNLVFQALETIQQWITAVEQVQRVIALSVAVQVGAAALLAVPAIGFVTARLRRKDGSPILVCEPKDAAGKPSDSRPRHILQQDQAYLMDIDFQREAPRRYQGAQARLVEIERPVSFDVIVEGGGIDVEGEGIAAESEGRQPFRFQAKPDGKITLQITPHQLRDVDLRIGFYQQGQWSTQLNVALHVVPDSPDVGVVSVGLPDGRVQPMLRTLPGDTDLFLPISAVVKGVEASNTLPPLLPDPVPRHLCLNLTYARAGRTYTAHAYNGMEWRTIGVPLTEDDLAELVSEFEQRLEAVRQILSDQLDMPTGMLRSEMVQQALDRLARLGNAAFQRIFPHPEDQQFVQQALAQANPANLEIATDRFFLPWELLYDAYDEEAVSFENFWGLRYNISRVLTNIGPMQSPVMYQTQPRIILCANTELRNVQEVEAPYFHRLQDEGLVQLWDWLEDRPINLDPKQEWLAFVQYSREHEAEVAHFACHASADPDYSGSWYLELSSDFRITLDDLLVEGYEMSGAPVVILNACGTAVRDPRKTGDFVQRFMKKSRRGALATECDVPDAFASVFIQRVYDQVLTGETFGQALLAARRHFWEQHHNPLGLLYAAYTRLETRILPGEEPGKQA